MFFSIFAPQLIVNSDSLITVKLSELGSERLPGKVWEPLCIEKDSEIMGFALNVLRPLTASYRRFKTSNGDICWAPKRQKSPQIKRWIDLGLFQLFSTTLGIFHWHDTLSCTYNEYTRYNSLFINVGKFRAETRCDDALRYFGTACFCSVLREHCWAEGALMRAYRSLNQVAAKLLIHYPGRPHSPQI